MTQVLFNEPHAGTFRICRSNHSTDPLFYTKLEQLTSYALHCGYIERTRLGTDPVVEVTLYAEHNVYQVKAGSSDGAFEQWAGFTKLREARKDFNRAKREATLWLLGVALGH